MSRTTPRVEAGELHESAATNPIPVDSVAWFAWLVEERHHSFHFSHTAGDFTARKERKQRGQWYWVAYRQVHCHLYKTYLGKTERLTESRLCVAAETLAALAATHNETCSEEKPTHEDPAESSTIDRN